MKLIYKIDLVIVFLTLIGIVFIFGYVSPMVISPLDGYSSTQTSVVFSIENADNLLIDDNIDFTSPDSYLIKDGLEISLKPGKYFWKVDGLFSSDIRTLNIDSEVNFILEELGQGYNVVNIGNVDLNVKSYDSRGLVSDSVVVVGDRKNLSGDKFVGEWNE
jgi:hypothetical protein